MSVNFTGVTFAQQKVAPSDDAIVRRAMLTDGILTGCELSYSGSTLTMAAGQLMICGRQFRHPSSQNWAVVDATSGYARLLLTIDMTRTSTKEVFEQVVDTIEYASALDGFPALKMDDVNGAGTVYQVVVCVVSLGAGGISGILSQLQKSGGLSLYNYIHNADFTRFVAQAGVGGKHGTQAYAGDRWILDSGTVTGVANADGEEYTNITLNGTIRQIIANAPDVATSGIEMVSGTATISYANGEVTITSSGGVIGFVKLFAGEFTADNMPKGHPKGYVAELQECKRYAVKLFGSNTYEYLYTGQSLDATHAFIPVKLDVPLREESLLPTVTTVGTLILTKATGSGTIVTAVEVEKNGNSAIILYVTCEGSLVAGNATILASKNAEGNVYLFMDL